MYRENSWKKYNEKQEKEVFKFAEGYKDFLSASKTERLAVKEAKARLDKAGYKNAEELKSVKPGDKVYYINRDKSIYMAVIGEEKLEKGLNILGAHIDYRQWKRDYNRKWNGVVGGLTYQPSFYQPLRGMLEWDGHAVNVGVDCRIYKYFFVQCGLYNCQDFTGGLCLCFNLL